jgi:rhodanese-related sulfurtransferase
MTRAIRSLAIGGVWALVTAGPVTATHSLGPMPVVPVIPAEHVKGSLDSGEQITLIDLRPAPEYEVRRLPRARSVPLSELRERYTEIPRTSRVILYCTCQPGEDWHAYELLFVRGYRNIVMLAGGFSGWLERGYPLEQR